MEFGELRNDTDFILKATNLKNVMTVQHLIHFQGSTRIENLIFNRFLIKLMIVYPFYVTLETTMICRQKKKLNTMCSYHIQ